MVAAGVNATAYSTSMRHWSIAVTLVSYGRLMPGSEEQTAGLLDAYRIQGSKCVRKLGDELHAELPPKDPAIQRFRLRLGPMRR